MTYLLLIISFLISNSDAFITDFYQFHNSFFNTPIKKIDFNYSINTNTNINPDGILKMKVKTLNTGTATLLIDKNNYKILFDDYVILYNNQTLKTYNIKTNQIFIENSVLFFDSLIFNFFNNYQNLKSNNFFSVDLDNDCIMIQDRDNKIEIFITNNSINKINGLFNNLIVDISMIKFSEYIYDNDKSPFQIDNSNAFILDLRD